MSASEPELPLSQPLRVAALASRKPTRFKLIPDAAQRAAIAAVLDISAVHALRFQGNCARAAARTGIWRAIWRPRSNSPARSPSRRW